MRALLQYPKGSERSNISTPIRRMVESRRSKGEVSIKRHRVVILEGLEDDLIKVADLVRQHGGSLFLDAKILYEEKITKQKK